MKTKNVTARLPRLLGRGLPALALAIGSMIPLNVNAGSCWRCGGTSGGGTVTIGCQSIPYGNFNCTTTTSGPNASCNSWGQGCS